MRQLHSRFWSSPDHDGKVGSVSSAERPVFHVDVVMLVIYFTVMWCVCRPKIKTWENQNDALPSVYGGHDSTVLSSDKKNLDIIGMESEVHPFEMDKDLTTRGQTLVQQLEDTSWAEADDSPNAR